MSPTRHSKKSANSLVILSILLIFSFFYGVSGLDPFGLFAETKNEQIAQTPINTLEPLIEHTSIPKIGTPTNSHTWWHVYFVNPKQITNAEALQYSIAGLPADLMSGSITESLIEHIDSAQKTIHIASFETNSNDVAKALIKAKGRGVDVRWITDDENGIGADNDPGRGQFAMLKKAGIKVIDDGRGALMHDKFWLFDGKTLWTGSTNITINGMVKQNNNVIVIDSTELTSMYEQEFNDMWAGKFNSKSPSTVDQQFLEFNGSSIQVLFSPEDHPIDHILPIIQKAKKDIKFLAFSYTQEQLGQSMLDAIQRGVQVSGVFESTGSDTEYSQLTPLYCAGAAVRQDGNPAFLHHKVIIVDDHIVLTGSLNFTDNATISNNENVIIIDNADIAGLYVQEFNRNWDVAHNPENGKIGCK